MFGKRSLQDEKPDHSHYPPPGLSAERIQQAPASTNVQSLKADQSAPTTAKQATGSQEGTASRGQSGRKTDEYYTLKAQVFAALIEAIDVAQLGKMDLDQARDAIGEIVRDIVTAKKLVMSIVEQDELLQDICNDVLGYGPLEPLLARDDIADIMVNGADTVYIEVAGKVQQTDIQFRDNAQLLHICQRIVSQVGRRVRRVPARYVTLAFRMARASM